MSSHPRACSHQPGNHYGPNCGSTVASVGLLLSVGVLPVAGQGSPIHVDSVPEVRLQEVMRWDLNDAPMARAPTSLTDPGDGSIFVVSGSDAAVFAFDAAGAFLGSLGRRGRGPGEFQAITTVGMHSDTLWVGDLLLGRITRFLKDGSVWETITPSGTAARAQGIPGPGAYVKRSPEGSVIGTRLQTMGQADPTGRELEFWWCWDPSTEVVDTLISRQVRPHSFRVPVENLTTRIPEPLGGSPGAIDFSGAAEFGLFAQGYAEGSEGRIVAERLYCGGRRDTSFVAAYNPKPVTDADVEAGAKGAMADFERRMSSVPGGAARPPRGMERQIRRLMHVPEHHKTVWELRQGQYGAIWMSRGPPYDYGTHEGVTWLIALDGFGPMGYVNLDFRQRPLNVSPEFVWLREPDPTQLTLGHIVKYRIVWQ